MSFFNNGGGKYQIAISKVILRQLRNLQRQATFEGRGAQAIEAIEQISQLLRQTPSVAGEPMYRLPNLRMQVRCCIVRPWIVHYAVCEDRPIVFIKGVQLLSAAE